ncbi:MAG: aminofutalosine synthase MqnE [Phycisphaerae bacterium]|nr:aminofutalosine synthase MqnE [Phycisphaerae bacterium]|tara:strand:- start:927 stop:2246 length:1320 start_codon:yes stop_codon:yes gene_type:complete
MAMTTQFLQAGTVAGCDPRLTPIIQKVESGERLSSADGMLLLETQDVWTVCSLADQVRRRMHGLTTWYNVNKHINYSNICALSCTFCAFHRKKDQDGAYEHSMEDIRREALAAVEAGATELHIVGGLHPWLKFDYYTDMMSMIREIAPTLHIKAFTAVEIVHLARISKRGRDGYEGILSVLRDLKEAGLGSLPGGGAEVFDDRVHDEAFKGKIRGDVWLDVHRAAHAIGLNSNATMLYGHVERIEERVRHMLLLRRQQDLALASWADSNGIITSLDPDEQSADAIVLTGPEENYSGPRLPVTSPDGVGEQGWFQTIVPLPFIPDNSELEHLPGPIGLENLRMIAVMRLMLDNIPHMKAFWIMHTLDMAQFMLQNGANDIDGTVVWYDITKVEGAGTHQETSVKDLKRAIREAGFIPAERDTLYRPVIRDGRSWTIDSSG